jgi:2-polyprenyl-6-methoxyphenol hydroxylase-like FAD-dependent oxidoreductase
MRAAGIEAFRAAIAERAPDLSDRVQELVDWEQVRLLTVQANRLKRWYRPGLLCIGDAAHAMSPVGGVGINFAIQDAVEAANQLAGPLLEGRVSVTDLAAVQRRRAWQVRIMQAIQARALVGALSLASETGGRRTALLRWLVGTLAKIPWLRDLPPRILALGIKRVHGHNPSLSLAGRVREGVQT